MHTSQWKSSYDIYESIIIKCTKALTATIGNTAIADQGISEALGNLPVVRITATAHGFAAGSMVYISGTTNYDGVHKLVAVATNTFDIVATYVAETPAGTETAKFTLFPGKAFALVEVRMFVSNGSGVAAAVGTAESLTVDLDSGNGNAFDVNMLTEPMSGLSSNVWVLSNDELRLFNKDDKLNFAFANTNTNTIGIEVIYKLEG